MSLPATDVAPPTGHGGNGSGRVASGQRRAGGVPPGTERSRGRGAAQVLLLAALRTYQALRSGHPSPCRFYPTCSTYAAEAVAEHGAWRGSWLAVRRVARCRPFGRHGVDLVPPATTHPRGGR